MTYATDERETPRLHEGALLLCRLRAATAGHSDGSFAAYAREAWGVDRNLLQAALNLTERRANRKAQGCAL